MFTVLGSFLFETCFWIFFRAVGPFSEPCPFGLTHLEFSGLHCCLFVKVLASILSKFSSGNLLKTTNGEGGIWTLAPLLTTYSLSRGAPSASWVLLQTKLPFNEQYEMFAEKVSPAERVGFEPTRPCGQTVFKTASLWPLRYLSMSCALNQRKDYSSKYRIQCQQFFQQIFLQFFCLIFTRDLLLFFSLYIEIFPAN